MNSTTHEEQEISKLELGHTGQYNIGIKLFGEVNDTHILRISHKQYNEIKAILLNKGA